MMIDNPKIEVLITIPFAEPFLERLRQVSPRLRINAIQARRTEDIPVEMLERCEVFYTDTVLPTLEQLPNLKWIQLHYAGLDETLDAPIFKKPDAVVTNLSGIAAPYMAEFILMMMLGLTHRLGDLTAHHSKMEWPQDRWERFMIKDFRGSTVGIVGYGSIGRETARLLQPFGVKILATKRNAMKPEDDGFYLEGTGDPKGDLFHRLYPPQALGSMLSACDQVVVCLPLTPDTRNLINEKMIRMMKPTATLIQVGRGGVVDQNALLLALQEKKIAGAALDAFGEEPLPANSPFWKLPNVLVTPHVGGISPNYRRDAAKLFEINLRRYVNGEPLLNLVDLERGY